MDIVKNYLKWRAWWEHMIIYLLTFSLLEINEYFQICRRKRNYWVQMYWLDFITCWQCNQQHWHSLSDARTCFSCLFSLPLPPHLKQWILISSVFCLFLLFCNLGIFTEIFLSDTTQNPAFRFCLFLYDCFHLLLQVAPALWEHLWSLKL